MCPVVPNGSRAIRCVYLANNATLVGFTLTGGATTGIAWDLPNFPESGGGGVWCESISALVSNCTITGNAAGSGGGVFGGTVKNCTVIGNRVVDEGAGAFGSVLYNCTLSGNAAGWACGGARDIRFTTAPCRATRLTWVGARVLAARFTIAR